MTSKAARMSHYSVCSLFTLTDDWFVLSQFPMLLLYRQDRTVYCSYFEILDSWSPLLFLLYSNVSLWPEGIPFFAQISLYNAIFGLSPSLREAKQCSCILHSFCSLTCSNMRESARKWESQRQFRGGSETESTQCLLLFLIGLTGRRGLIPFPRRHWSLDYNGQFSFLALHFHDFIEKLEFFWWFR